ncbi:uncharacterized protein RCC_10407 [Ramularia collo-cygni]|uniref:Extracellular membrane protein CFEM domain-containing protein n=1 Tax=Ramularia collo-cygni TaxID=112498 RepID=A0A2D3VCE8_9PEZI|nr:uncharacterized protein RCC_10407 [Ramularia collo-cygni]CZT24680.1 uncharacterized protein RCC_10407 [Ramularia collo-cygni]
MFSKLSAVFAVFAIAAQVAFASPPACLIGAVNTQDNPHDIKGVCSGDAAKEVAKSIGANCGDAKDDATKWFTSVCKDAGVTVSMSSSESTTKSSSKSSSTESSDSSSTMSSGPTTTGDSTASASVAPTATGSDSPDSTGMASRVGMDMLGLAAVGIFGAMIVL